MSLAKNSSISATVPGRSAPFRKPGVAALPAGVLWFSSQILILRELFSVLSANELTIGAGLGVWLIASGTASRHAPRSTASAPALAILWTLSALFIFVAIPALRAFRPLAGLAPGELVPLLPALGMLVLSTALPAFLSGWQFPLLLMHFPDTPPPRLYAWESLGGAVAAVALLALFRAGVSNFHLAAGVASGYLLLAAGAWPAKATPGPWRLLALLPIAVSIPAGPSVAALPLRSFELVAVHPSRDGEIAVVHRGAQTAFFQSGSFRFASPDPVSDEALVHTALSLVETPKRALLLSGSPGLVSELLKYRELRIDLVEDDPVMLKAMLEDCPGGTILQDDRVRALTVGVRPFLARDDARNYDVVLLNRPPPRTALDNRFFTLNFFRLLRKSLRPGGLVVVRGIPGFGYTARSALFVNASIRTSLGSALGTAVAAGRESGLILATDAPGLPDPASAGARFRARGIATVSFTPEILADVFGPDMARYNREMEAVGKTPNTDDRPVGFLLSLGHWLDMNRLPRGLWVLWPAIGLFLLIAALASRGPVRSPAAVAARLAVGLGGFAGMTGSTVVLLGYQAVYGHVYEAMSLLSGAFLAGMAAGARVGAGPPRTDRSGLRRLLRWEGAFVLVLLCGTAAFGSVVLPYALNALLGFLTGGLFATAARTGTGRTAVAADLYGIDLWGSAAGAFAGTIGLVPFLGLSGTFDTLAAFMTVPLGVVILLLVKGRLDGRRDATRNEGP